MLLCLSSLVSISFPLLAHTEMVCQCGGGDVSYIPLPLAIFFFFFFFFGGGGWVQGMGERGGILNSSSPRVHLHVSRLCLDISKPLILLIC